MNTGTLLRITSTKRVHAPILASPDHNKQFILDKDASKKGVRDALPFIYGTVKKVVTAYACKVLSKLE